MCIPVIGMGDTAEALLASRVPYLWQQALVMLSSPSLIFPVPNSPFPQSPYLQLHLHAIHIQNFVLKQNQPAPVSTHTPMPGGSKGRSERKLQAKPEPLYADRENEGPFSHPWSSL